MNIKLLFLLIFFLKGFFTFAQSQFNYSFYKNLLNQKETDLALLNLNNALINNNNQEQIDSIQFFKGLLFFEKKNFDSANFSLKNVSNSSSIFIQSSFVRSIALGYSSNNGDTFIKVINEIPNNDSIISKIKIMMLASNALINNNYPIYDSLISQINDSLYIYNTLQSTLNKWNLLRNKKAKSEFLAGTLSAIIPGLGKVYAGKGFDGLSTFFTHIPLALILNESLHGSGVNSARFITFASITSLFYFGNIITSYYYVNINRKEVDFERKNEVLLQCNVMLRNHYN